MVYVCPAEDIRRTVNLSVKAEADLKDYSEHAVSTELFPKNRNEILNSFNHECTTSIHVRRIPQVIPEQGLRDLRNKHGHKDTSASALRGIKRFFARGKE